MLGLLEQSPDLYLDEILDRLKEQHGVTASLSCIFRTLKRLGMSSKKLSRTASERSEEARMDFSFQIGEYPPEYLVAADEAAVNILTTYRTNGWSLKGLRARKQCCFCQRYSILPALTMNGIIYSEIKEGSFNGDEFLEWLDGLLEIMNPYPAPNSVLILDNCRIHHVEGVEERCNER
ncbi:hypothetical protein CVT24_012184 [Panaeolus cyanescens]|uniref:Uncharacterized protein n=1 Tax=Panaeolus cyanescens TaxID=181874 RepID=A0A409X179_9AGAR|nr:hypothetical protein CVT24_012184 [Panaeolus cyanescens]